MGTAQTIHFNPLAYYYFSPLTAGFTLIFLFWCFLRRWNSAFGVALVGWWGLGHAGIGTIRYSYVLYVLSLIVIIRMTRGWMRSGQRFATSPKLIPLKVKILLGLLTVIWTKAGVDTLSLGWDEFRQDAYYSLLFFALPGAVLVAAAFAVQPWRLVVRQMLLSGLTIGGVYFLFGVIGAVAYEPATLFLWGSSRMTLHNIDTINAVRFAPLLALGLFYLVLLRPSFVRSMMAATGFCALALVLVLVGTRQIAISVLLVTACSLFVVRHRVIGVGLFVTAMLVGTLVVGSGLIEYTPLVERAVIASESGDGRIGIWRDAYIFTMERPLSGGGFRTFGDFTENIHPATGEITFGRANAHGIFQDVFTDHGVILGVLFLFLSIAIMLHGLFLASRSDSPEAKTASLLPIALWSPLFFSGALYSAWGFYLGCVVYAGVVAGIRGERTQRNVLASPLASSRRQIHS